MSKHGYYVDDERMAAQGNGLVMREDCIVVPRFSKNYPLLVRLDLIAKAEVRMAEVAFVTKEKAPELLSALNIAWRDLHEIVTLMRREVDLAKDNIIKVRARVLLDEVLPKIKEKGLPSSKDIRDAVLEGHPEVQEAQSRAYEITCVAELLSGKLKAMEMAYTSVKKILGESAFNYGPNPNLSGGGSSAPVGTGDRAQTMSGTEQAYAAFGTPKY